MQKQHPFLSRLWSKRALYRPQHLAKIFWLISFLLAILCASWLIFLRSERTKPLAYRNPDNLQLVGPGAIPNTMIPMGTSLTIPHWLVHQYHTSGQTDLYGDILNFMVLNYGIPAPSVENKEKDTYYVPLTRYKKPSYDSDSYDRRSRRRTRSKSRRVEKETTSRDTTFMVDVTKVTIATPPPPSGKAPALLEQEPDQRTKGTSSTNDKPAEEHVEASHPVVFKTTEDIDTSQSPPVPPPKEPTDLSKPATEVQATCDSVDGLTEGKGPCIDCVQEKESIVEDFLDILDITTTRQIKVKNFSTVINKFCEKCEGQDVGNFFSYMEERAKQANVPKEILFAIMMRESNGDCNIVNDTSDSHGLFQLNPKNSTRLRACKKGELKGKSTSQLKTACQGGTYRKASGYRSENHNTTVSKRSNLGSMICLENPYCNFEEALHLLTEEKWSIGNRGSANSREPPSLDGKEGWADLSSDERNQWRNALIAYHGNYYHGKAKKAMRQAVGVEADLDDWELKRLFFIKQYLGLKQIRTGLITNLAYVESLAGRETKDGLASSSICQWARFRKQNPSPSCP